MRVLALGGAEAVAREATRDLCRYGESIREIVIADIDPAKAEGLARDLGNPRVRVVPLDVRDEEALVRMIRGFDVVMNGLPFAYDVLFTRAFLLNFEGTLRDHRDTMRSDIELYTEIGLACYERGVMFEVDPREPWFTSAAHTPEVVDETLNRFADAMRAVLKGRRLGPAEITAVGK